VAIQVEVVLSRPKGSSTMESITSTPNRKKHTIRITPTACTRSIGCGDE
jgi:hypothetical protein